MNQAGLQATNVVVQNLNEADVDLYAWISDTLHYAGIAWVGTACRSSGGYKTSLTGGPSRSNAIVETAEVSNTILHRLHYIYQWYALFPSLIFTCSIFII